MLVIPIEEVVGTAAAAPTARVLQTAAIFGLGIGEHRAITIVPPCEIPLPFPHHGIVLITGPSGGGKSTILRLIEHRCRDFSRRVINLDQLPPAVDAPLVDIIAANSTSADALAEATRTLSIAGLGDAFVMLRRPSELSDGQRFRLKLARAMQLADASDDAAIILADEFGATLDRPTAKIIAVNLQRWISRHAKRSHTFVCATTHDDLLESLKPDVLVWKGLGDEIEIAQRPDIAAFRSASAEHGAQSASLPDDLRIERGTSDDYKQLSQFHYRSGTPGAVKDVFRMVRHGPTVIGRYLYRKDERKLIGVLMRSLPPLSCRMRDVATNGRYSGLGARDAAVLLNREVRTISRVVIDPAWRGCGLAVRLVRHALEHPEPGTVYTEALAAMGRVSPFFERAGMTRYDRPPQRSRPEHARLIDAMDELGISPAALASPPAVQHHIDGLDESRRAWLESELRRWHRAAHRIRRATSIELPLHEILESLRDELLLDPVYYAYQHC
jgi:ABC-type lipoprotein export system ATPase subunit/GNAT superfamily N-acetyltransferase